MDKYNKIVGDYGEQIACNFLKKNRYSILTKNIKTSYQELDIVAKQNNTLTFIEVKTRTTNSLGLADEMLNPKKIHNLKKAISIYLNNHNTEQYNDIRLDFISIDINKNNKTAKLKHYKDII